MFAGNMVVSLWRFFRGSPIIDSVLLPPGMPGSTTKYSENVFVTVNNHVSVNFTGLQYQGIKYSLLCALLRSNYCVAVV